MSLRQLTVLLFTVLALFCSKNAWAGTQIFIPVDADGDDDFQDFDHRYAYQWGINYTVPSGQVVTGASLFFDNIANWDNNPNKLYMTLMDTPTAIGVSRVEDNPGDPNNGVFDDYWQSHPIPGAWTDLTELTNLTTTPQDITYNFTSGQIQALNNYLANGNNFAIGFDPDCHYFNDKVKLTLTYEPAPPPTGNPAIPEPVTSALGLMALSSLSLALRRRRA